MGDLDKKDFGGSDHDQGVGYGLAALNLMVRLDELRRLGRALRVRAEAEVMRAQSLCAAIHEGRV